MFKRKNLHIKKLTSSFRRVSIITLLIPLSFYLFYDFIFFDFSSLGLNSGKVETILSAKKVNFYLQESTSSFKIYAPYAEMFVNEKTKEKVIALEGGVVSEKKEQEESYKISSTSCHLIWQQEKDKKSLGKDNLTKILFNGNVILEKEDRFLFTKSMIYETSENFLYGENKAKILSKNEYIECQKGFKWDLQKDILSVNQGIEGISYDFGQSL